MTASNPPLRLSDELATEPDRAQPHWWRPGPAYYRVCREIADGMVSELGRKPSRTEDE